MGPTFFSPGDSHTRGMLLLHLGLEGSEVDTNQKGSLVSFKVTPSNESPLLVLLQGIAPGLARGAFLKDYKMQNKNEGSENKIMLGDLNCTMDKTDKDGENKTQIPYRCCSNYALSRLIVDN